MDITPKNKLTLEEHKLINGLSNYLDIQFYYYGSIQRDDYIPGKSDIDVAIFTDNEKSVIVKMQHYLKVEKEKFTKVLWKLKQHNTIIYGNKLKYDNEKNDMHIEFAIYNEKSKEDIIKFQNETILIPFYITWIFTFLKVLYYQWNILPLPVFNYLKRVIFGMIGIGNDDNEKFIVLKQPKKY
jgi:predicted nucleotidyltransferase